MLMMANHEGRDVIVGKHVERVERGSFITSERKLAERWGWSKKRTTIFLKMLEKLNQIEPQKNHQRTAIKIVNYCIYQNDGTTTGTTTGTTRVPTGVPTRVTQTRSKEDKEEKNIYSRVSEEAIAHLNQRTGRRFNPKTKNVLDLVAARSKEGYTLDDFKTVIDNKVKDWKGTSYEKYLQPSTLFAPSHFDEYLNQGSSVREKRMDEVVLTDYDRRNL